MELTRIDSKKLTEAVVKARKKLAEAEALLQPYLVLLTDEERATMPRTRDGLAGAVRLLADAVRSHPNIAQVSGFDPDAAIEDAQNVETLAPLAGDVDDFARKLSDSRLTWAAEMQQPSLAAYGVAKVLARTDPTVKKLVDPIAEVFAVRGKKKPDPLPTK